jgi:hypothetical protein
MLARLLTLPAVLWLLLPPGVCICHLPEQVVSRLRGQVPPPDHHDHSNCPCCHKPDCDHPVKTPELPSHAGLVIALAVPAPAPAATLQPLTVVRPVSLPPPTTDLYLQVCALRI